MASRDNRQVAAAMAAEMGDFLLAGAIQLAVNVVEANNSGQVPAPIDTGELRASVRPTVGTPSNEAPDKSGSYSNVTEAEVRQAITFGAPSPGDTIWLTWIAAHAVIIAGGRRPDRNGRMIGSLQAPNESWVDPYCLDEALSKLDGWKYLGDGGGGAGVAA